MYTREQVRKIVDEAYTKGNNDADPEGYKDCLSLNEWFEQNVKPSTPVLEVKDIDPERLKEFRKEWDKAMHNRPSCAIQPTIEGAHSFTEGMNINVPKTNPTDNVINNWVEWIDKRCGFTDHQKDYVFFVIKQITKNLMTDKSGMSELLAVLHGDGGHYEQQHGTTKAIEDAKSLIHTKWVSNDALVDINKILQDNVRLKFDFEEYTQAYQKRQSELVVKLYNDLLAKDRSMKSASEGFVKVNEDNRKRIVELRQALQMAFDTLKATYPTYDEWPEYIVIEQLLR